MTSDGHALHSATVVGIGDELSPDWYRMAISSVEHSLGNLLAASSGMATKRYESHLFFLQSAPCRRNL